MAFNNLTLTGNSSNNLSKFDTNSICAVLKKIIYKDDSGFFIAIFQKPETPEAENWPSGNIEGFAIPKNEITARGNSTRLINQEFENQIVDLQGDFVLDKIYGVQYNVSSIRERMPDTIDALQKYLSAGRLKGIGPNIALKIVERFGLDFFDIIEKDSAKLLEVSGITLTKIETIKNDWTKKKSLYSWVSFMGLHNIGEAHAIKIFDFYKGIKIDYLIKKIKENPYSVMEVDGIGFKTADGLAISLGLDPKSYLRMSAALEYKIKDIQENEGHTAIPGQQLIQNTAEEFMINENELRNAFLKLLEERKVVLRSIMQKKIKKTVHGDYLTEENVPCVSLTKTVFQESYIASRIIELASQKNLNTIKEISVFEAEINNPQRGLDISQKMAAFNSLNYPVSILTGGPGTGKTTTLKTIVEAAKKAKLKVVLGAPTGRAAKRMSDAINEKARTIHLILGAVPTKGFSFNESNPVDGDLFIIDEASMIETTIMNALLKAMPKKARLILVGDKDQLPSVGAGDIFRNLINSKIIPVSVLSYIYRTKEGSLIAENASKIKNGMMPEYNLDPYNNDFSFIETVDDDETLKKIIDFTNYFVDNNFYEKNDIQILAAQKNGKVGVENLNLNLCKYLRSENKTKNAVVSNTNSLIDIDNTINKIECVSDNSQDINSDSTANIKEKKHFNFQEGDRVMQTKNYHDQDFFNGDMCIVKKIHENNEVEVETEDGKILKLNREQAKNLTLGYAQTVHKSQGGERPVIIFPICAGHSITLNRSLLYTGVTRGKEKVLVIGSKKVLNRTIRKQEQNKRITGLIYEFELYKKQILEIKNKI